MGLVLLNRYENTIDAHFAKTLLESEEIICFIFDENINTIQPLYNLATGGIRLMVPEEEYHRAKALLSLNDDANYLDKNDKALACPKCSSTNLYGGFKSMKGIKGFLSLISSFLFMVLPIYTKTVYRCKNCDYEFNNEYFF